VENYVVPCVLPITEADGIFRLLGRSPDGTEMAGAAEVAKTENEPGAVPMGGARLVQIIGAAPPVGEQLQRPKFGSGRRLATHMGLSFGLLICIMFGVACWVSYQSAASERLLQASLAQRSGKLQLVYDALQYSNANSRLTMQALLQKSASPQLLNDRARNSAQISERIAALEQHCDSQEEKQLLLSVNRERARYVELYLQALSLLSERNTARAEVVMLQQATPALFAYRAAWQEFAWFELGQIKKAADQNAERHIKIRHIGLTLQLLSGLITAAIAVFTTSAMIRDLKLRTHMQWKLSGLNAELEQRVTKRTRELASAEQQLRESLAQSQEYAREIEAVNELTKLLQSCLTLDEAHQQASRVMAKFFPAGVVLMLNPSRNLLDIVMSWGAASSREGPFLPESCWGLRKGEVHLAGPHCPNPVCSHFDQQAEGCHICIPLIAQGVALGVLSVDHPTLCGGDPKSRICKRKLKLVRTLAEQISLAFANLSLRETLKYQSVRDPLTGLFNRRHMEEILGRELHRAARNATSIAVLMVDIDHFKHFNDMYGHEAGDIVLREFGLLLRLHVRGADIACRYGGEEFLLIMSETDLETADQRAETLRERVAAMPLTYRGRRLPSITISVGLASFPEHGSSAAQIVAAADAALYRAKREGRDRVLVAE
jgi:diguanylate cyclase (GGDEF)-like protein